MKNIKFQNVFQYLKTADEVFNKEKEEKNKLLYQTKDESDDETSSSNKTQFEKDSLERSFSLDYFKNYSSISSDSNAYFNEKEEKVNKFNYTSKNKFFSEDFEILNLLGSGAYAKVYKTRYIKTNKIYAIKMIDKILMEKEEKLSNVYLENEFLNILSHPHIVKTYGIFEDDERINIVLEYVPKGTLANLIEKTSNNITCYLMKKNKDLYII